MIYSTRQFVLSLALCYFILVFFSPFSIAITSLGVKRANLCFFVVFFLYICSIYTYLVVFVSLPPGVWEGRGTHWTFLLPYFV